MYSCRSHAREGRGGGGGGRGATEASFAKLRRLSFRRLTYGLMSRKRHIY